MKKKRTFLDHFSPKTGIEHANNDDEEQHKQEKRNDFEKNDDDSDDKGQFDVSVLLPVHNALPHLTSCLICLFAQEKVKLEIVIVDNSSTDGSFERIGVCKRAYEKLKEGDGGEWKLTEDEKEEKEDVGNDFYANKVECGFERRVCTVGGGKRKRRYVRANRAEILQRKEA